MSAAPEPPAGVDTLAAVLRWRAAHQGEKLVFGFLDERLELARALTFRELDRRARAVAAGLQALAPAGERVLLALPSGPEFVAAFFACLYADMIAVPSPPPRPGRSLDRLQAIVEDARPMITVADGDALAGLAGTRVVAMQALGDDEDAFQEVVVAPDRPAFLQYTSGSTGTPKGVIVTHANLMHNGAAIRQGFGHGPDTIGLVWLPPHHDMGLIGGLLQPVYAGFLMYIMSPTRFLMRPMSWLQAISRYRASTSGGPNFAYDLVVERIRPEQLDGLDLSSWRVAFNGAEPVRAASLARFSETFAAIGFDPTAHYPCYGLAEASLIVAGGRPDTAPTIRHADAAALASGQVALTAPEGARPLVSSGGVLGGQTVRIVDPTMHVPCQPGRVGEIWLAGPSVARGYWGRPEETALTFAAHTASGEGPFLRTGDLGTVIDGELFVTGRHKDLIIIDGRNLYPQDLEATAQRSHPGLRPAGGAAFAVDGAGGEALVIVHEIERGVPAAALGEVARAVRGAITQAHEVAPQAVVLIKAGSLPKTTSGKIRRADCRLALAAGELEVVWSWP